MNTNYLANYIQYVRKHEPAYLIERTRAGATMDWKIVRSSDGYTVSYHATYQQAQKAAAAWNREAR